MLPTPIVYTTTNKWYQPPYIIEIGAYVCNVYYDYCDWRVENGELILSESQVEEWIKDLESNSTEKRASRNSSKRTTLSTAESLKKTFEQLKEKLLQLKPPEGFEDADTSIIAEEKVETPKSEAADEQEDVVMEEIMIDSCSE